MRTLKISLLVFVLPITLFAQDTKLMYQPIGESRIVQIAEAFESVIEVKCFEVESDTGNYFIILNKIINFSGADIIWKLGESEIYNQEMQFKPVGYQTIINIDQSLSEIINLQPIKEIEVKSKSSLSILILFSKKENNDRYERILDDMDADIIVGTAGLKSKQNAEWIFIMIYFKNAN